MALKVSAKQLKLDATLKSETASCFKSTVITGNGSAQNTAHGLGRTPAKVLVMIYGSPATYSALTVTEGTHTTTNCVVTVTTSWKYVIFAW